MKLVSSLVLSIQPKLTSDSEIGVAVRPLGAVGVAVVAVALGDLAGKHGADRTVDVADRDFDGHLFTALKRRPGLAVIMVCDDPASQLYVRNKRIAAEKIGVDFHLYRCGSKEFYPNITQIELLEMIDWLNNDLSVDAIIVQLPLPKKYETKNGDIFLMAAGPKPQKIFSPS